MSLAREIADEIEKDRIARELVEIEARMRRADAEWEYIMAFRQSMFSMEAERERERAEERRNRPLARLWRMLRGEA